MGAQTIQDDLNHPSDALSLWSDAYDSMYRYLAWGIEAISLGDQVSFFSSVVVLNSHIT